VWRKEIATEQCWFSKEIPTRWHVDGGDGNEEKGGNKKHSG